MRLLTLVACFAIAAASCAQKPELILQRSPLPTCLEVSPNRSYAAIGGMDGFSVILDLSTGRVLRRISHPLEIALNARFNRLLQASADRVVELAKTVGGIQRPRYRTRGDGRSFDIGKLTLEDRSRIPLPQRKPIFVRPSFQEEARARDPLSFSKVMQAELAASLGTERVYWDVQEHPGGIVVAGRYAEDSGGLVVKVDVYQIVSEGVTKDIDSFEMRGKKADLADLARQILGEVIKRLGVGKRLG